MTAPAPAPDPVPASSPQLIVLIGWLFAVIAVAGLFASEASASLPVYLVIGALAPLVLWPIAALASVLPRGTPPGFAAHGRRLWPAHAGVVAVCAVDGYWWLTATGIGLDRNYPVLVLSWAAGLQILGLSAMAYWLSRRPRTRPVASHTALACALAAAGWVAGGPILALLRAQLR